MALSRCCCVVLYPAVKAQDFKPYNNYDFIPGSRIIFWRWLWDDTDGEFLHWKLPAARAWWIRWTVTGVCHYKISMVIFSPISKSGHPLPAITTIEFDNWLDAGYDSNEGTRSSFASERETKGFHHHQPQQFYILRCRQHSNSAAHLPGYPRIANENHLKPFGTAIASGERCAGKSLLRPVSCAGNPDAGFKASKLAVLGNASEGPAMLFKNFRLAEGGGMNMPGKNSLMQKIVTHGNNSDYNKASIKPGKHGQHPMPLYRCWRKIPINIRYRRTHRWWWQWWL